MKWQQRAQTQTADCRMCFIAAPLGENQTEIWSQRITFWANLTFIRRNGKILPGLSSHDLLAVHIKYRMVFGTKGVRRSTNSRNSSSECWCAQTPQGEILIQILT